MDHSPENAGTLLDLTEREGVCPDHGQFVSRNLFRGRVWSKCPACEEVGAAKHAEAERIRMAREAEQRHAAMLHQARIPTRFIGRTFESFVAADEAQRHALTTMQQFVARFDANSRKGAGLILSGLPGTGKSHLVAAALQALFPRDVAYMTCMDLIRGVRDTWRRDSERSETQVLKYLECLDLLAIDEVGVQYGTDGEQTILFDVLDRRYREVRPTIILTNQDKAGLKKFIGERAYDRLTETCVWVPFDWPSYRPQARREAA